MNRAHEILAELRAEIENAQRAELPAIIGQVEAVKAEAFARLVAAPEQETPAVPTADEMLDVDAAATMLGKTSRWVKRHAKELPRVDLPGNRLVFSSKKLAAFVKKRQVQVG